MKSILSMIVCSMSLNNCLLLMVSCSMSLIIFFIVNGCLQLNSKTDLSHASSSRRVIIHVKQLLFPIISTFIVVSILSVEALLSPHTDNEIFLLDIIYPMLQLCCLFYVHSIDKPSMQ